MARPNILIFMVDQLNGTLFPDGPADFLHAPNLRKLAARSFRFANTYTPSPLCAPARASFMAGQLPSRTGVYDNAAEFQSSIPTFAHHLRRAGYATTLSGKMHFVGPDQLHGFENRLTTDVYPADFGWTPNYSKPGQRIDWWYHNMGSVTGAGVAETTNQLEYDDEVAHFAGAKLYDLARAQDERPWLLTVSFTHPHDPYVSRRKYWDLYEDCARLDPAVGAVPFDELEPHSQRLLKAAEAEKFAITEEDVRRSRRAYFANISYIDEKIGELLGILERCRMAEDTVVLFLSDHGDMLGERGLWFKMSFREGSARVPLMMALPGREGGRLEGPVSTLDVMPTLAELAGVEAETIAPFADGVSLMRTIKAGVRPAVVPIEYAAEGSIAPMGSLREGTYKLNVCPADPVEFYDLSADPLETANLAADPHAMDGAARDAFERLSRLAAERWDFAAFDAAVRESQERRHVTDAALRNGAYYPWDFQPLQKASERYMRNHMDLNVLEESQRFPRGE